MDRTFRPLRAAARQLRRAAGAALSRPPVPRVQPATSATAAASCSRSCTTARDGRLLDLGTKGSGRTPWSRGGDGRLTLKGGVRELLASRAAGGARRRHLQDLQPDRDRRGAGAQRRAVADPLRRAGAAEPLPHPHRHLPAPRLSRGHRAAAAPARLLRPDLHAGRLARGRGGPRGGVSRAGRAPTSPAPGRSGWPPASCTACSTPTTSTSRARASTTAPGASCRTYDPGFTAAYFDESGLYCLRPAAGDAAVESDAAGRVPAAAGAPGRAGDGAAQLSARVPARARGGGAAPSGPALGRCHSRTVALVDGVVRLPREQTGRRSSRPSSTGAAGSQAAERAAAGPSAGTLRVAGIRAGRDGAGGLRSGEGAGLDQPYFASGRPCTMLIDEVEAIWAPIAAADDWSLLVGQACRDRPRCRGLRNDDRELICGGVFAGSKPLAVRPFGRMCALSTRLVCWNAR